MSFVIPTPILGLVIFVSVLAATTALIIAGEDVPGFFREIMAAALGATLGGAAPVIGGQLVAKQ